MKPENVLFTAAGRPLVADLGLAKHFDADAPRASQSVPLSQAGTLRGTAGYMAARADARREGASGPPADVFALGAILYECLAGEPPFAARTSSSCSVGSGGRFEPLAKRRPEVPAWLVQIVERSLERAPQRQFANGVELLRALEGEDWGPPKRVPGHLPFVVRRAPPPSADDLEVPPSLATAAETDRLDLTPTVRDTGERIFTARPADAPPTLRVSEIPSSSARPRSRRRSAWPTRPPSRCRRRRHRRTPGSGASSGSPSRSSSPRPRSRGSSGRANVSRMKISLRVVESARAPSGWIVAVELVFTNDGAAPFELDRASTADGGRITNDLFSIRLAATKEPVPYTGIMKKRAHPGRDGFVRVKPGESVAQTARLDDYRFPASGGAFTIAYSTWNHFSKDAVKLASNEVAFTLA